MTLLECLTTFINADSVLATNITGGISPQILPESPMLPQMVFKVVSSAPERATHDGGASPWSRVRIEMTVWGKDFLVQEKAALRLGVIFRPFNGYLGGGSNGQFTVTSVTFPRTLQDPLTRLVGVQVDILGMLNAATLS